MNQNHEVDAHLANLSSDIDSNSDSLAIVLAAGHGKRIKSETSKMLHEIWGVPTVVRVANSAKQGLNSTNQIIVVLDLPREKNIYNFDGDQLLEAMQSKFQSKASNE